MQDRSSTFDGSDTEAGARPRGGTTVRLRPPSDTVIDLRDAGGTRPRAKTKSPGRRFAPYPGESDRDAIVATALAFQQSVPQAPSVLDVDAAALRMATPAACKPQVEACWTPPALPVDTAIVALADRQLEADLDDFEAPAGARARRTWLLAGAAAGLVVLLGGGLSTLLFERDDVVAAASASMPIGEVADPALLPDDGLGTNQRGVDEPVEPLARVEGKLTLEDGRLLTWPAAPDAPSAQSFALGTDVILRLNAAYHSDDAGDVIAVVWFRGDQELRREELLLADDMERVSYGPSLDQPGPYRAELVLNDQIVVETFEFEVTQ